MIEISVLIIEDSFYSADLNIRELKKAGFKVRFQMVSNGQSMKIALKKDNWDLIISDNSMPNFSALRALEIRNNEDRHIPFIIVSEDFGHRDIDKAFKEGCSAYVEKENLAGLREASIELLLKKI